MFNKLLKVRQPRQDPEKVIFNYSNISLSDADKSLLVKGLKFSIPPKKLSYADYLTNFELFYRSIYNLDSISNKNLVFVKTKINDVRNSTTLVNSDFLSVWRCSFILVERCLSVSPM